MRNGIDVYLWVYMLGGVLKGQAAEMVWRLRTFMGRKKNWSTEEIDYLQEAWGKTSLKTICRNLGRTQNAVVLKASRLSLGAFKDGNGVMTLCQLASALGYTGSYSWIKQKLLKNGLPVIKQKIRSSVVLKVDIEKFWEWAETNKHVINWSKAEKNILGIEPKWVDERRKIDFYNKSCYNKPWKKSEEELLKAYLGKGLTYIEISKRIDRTSEAVRRRIYELHLDSPKRESVKTWTNGDAELAIKLREQGYSYRSIAERLNRSQGSVRGKLDRINNPEYSAVRSERRRRLKEVEASE